MSLTVRQVFPIRVYKTEKSLQSFGSFQARRYDEHLEFHPTSPLHHLIQREVLQLVRVHRWPVLERQIERISFVSDSMLTGDRPCSHQLTRYLIPEWLPEPIVDVWRIVSGL